MTAEEDRRMTLLEMQVGALIKQREHYASRISKLREFIGAHGHITSADYDPNCTACKFLKDDAQS